MSTSARRPSSGAPAVEHRGARRSRSALDRLSPPPVEQLAPPHAPDVDVSAVWDSAPDPAADVGPGAPAPIDQPVDTGAVDSPWGVAAVPTWLDPVPPEERPRSRMIVGDSFGEPDPDELDEAGPRRRFAVAPPAAIALILVGIVACAVAGFTLLGGGSEDATTPVAFPTAAGPTGSAAAPAASVVPPPAAEDLVVSVVGLVHRPGLVRLRGQARVADAIDRAGGARQGADLLSLNLAQRLNDGDQILVGYAGSGGRMSMRSAVVGPSGAAGAADPPSAGSGGPATSGPTGGTTGKVNLNTATEAQLDELPGVGPVTAKAIIGWRDTHGQFASVEQLGEVDGIGPARLAKLRDLVTV
ncbi:helix-hairpin-helix domain-containing protein [Gordonia sp. DT218]|uniref:helix-hairpin-helix domain-containing protein n=1 Tax=unclassified Gordonia (in: high G+C Gram-positive bacteria) TaxID=2657482 RepID=UPI003CE93657